MRKDNYKVLSLAALVIAICSLTLGYAALTQTLNINIGGTVQSGQTTWNIHFESNGKAATKVGNAVLGTMDLKQTTITLSGVTLKTEGDSVTYSFNVVNDGELDAMISVLTPTTVTVTGGTTTEQNAMKEAYTYTLKYADGSAVGLNDSLLADEEKEMLLTISLKEGITLPSSNVTISNIGYTITYTQKTSVSGGGSEEANSVHFGEEYVGTNNYGNQMNVVFNADGSAKIFEAHRNFEKETFSYSLRQVVYETRVGSFSEDGIEVNGEYGLWNVLDLDTSNLTLNEYGFYYDAPYSIYDPYDGIFALVYFYEDGSGLFGGLMNALTGSLTYENENILMGGQLYGTVSSGGNVITVTQNGETFTLTLNNN